MTLTNRCLILSLQKRVSLEILEIGEEMKLIYLHDFWKMRCLRKMSVKVICFLGVHRYSRGPGKLYSGWEL